MNKSELDALYEKSRILKDKLIRCRELLGSIEWIMCGPHESHWYCCEENLAVTEELIKKKMKLFCPTCGHIIDKAEIEEYKSEIIECIQQYEKNLRETEQKIIKEKDRRKFGHLKEGEEVPEFEVMEKERNNFLALMRRRLRKFNQSIVRKKNKK